VTRTVVFVFDGLQAELVTPELMPNLSLFAATGARFQSHQPVFPTVTRVNAASIVTGCFPGTHGLAGNMSLVPEWSLTEPMNAMKPEFQELLASGGRVLLVPTLAELLAAHELEYIAVGIGTTGQSFVHHPNGEDAEFGASIHPQYALPGPLFRHLVARFGAWPDHALPDVARIEQMIDITTQYVLAERDPAVTLIWSSEPDNSQHGSPLNSPTVHQAVHAADAGFGRLLAWLEENDRASDTNVIVTCDHGHTTVSAVIPVAELLAEVGFPRPGEPGGIVVANNGGAALFYIQGHDAEIADRLAEWLVAQPWAGPLLAADRFDRIRGTLPTSLVGLDGPRGPDLALSFAWNERVNEHGAVGHSFVAGGPIGQGQHGSMSPQELRTFTVARGPDFKANVSIPSVTGHPDLAPTILRTLGITPPPHMDGRVIEEALADGDPTSDMTTSDRVASRTVTGGTYMQRLTVAPATRGSHLLWADARFVRG
jgi:phosphonoacetate hydrolase